MPADDRVEQAIQALLDGMALAPEFEASPSAPLPDPLGVVDAIARAHRAAIFGADVPLDPAARARWGHLEIRSEMGRGASGTVHRAWDAKLAREVALKLLAHESSPATDALAEGRLLARLNHPHIVRVFGADTHDGVDGIWMELLEGDTLDEIVARDGNFGVEEALLVGIDIAAALAAVHAAGLLHRDVKARNVLRERGGRIVVMDLGAGRTADAAPQNGDETGTPLYMAPEVLGGAPASPQSDIYSVAVLMYRLLTGTYPVTAETMGMLRAAHERGGRTALDEVRPDLPAPLVAAVERGCHPVAAARYATAAELEAALRDVLRHVLVERAPVASAMARRWARWRTATLAAVLVLTVAATTTVATWDTVRGRAARRAIGLTVPPRSTLYIATNGGITLVRGRTVNVVPYNPGTAGTIAASEDLGIRSMSSNPPWTTGAAFGLDGVPMRAPPVGANALCCWGDGTTDGRYNYAVRADSTLLEPIGSRPLAPPAVYRFRRDWSGPQLAFSLGSTGQYEGLTFSRTTNTFWTTKRLDGDAVIEEWSRDGAQLGTAVRLKGAVLPAIAADPADGTLWAVRPTPGGAKLENFDTTGRRLATVDVDTLLGTGAAEFAWVAPR